MPGQKSKFAEKFTFFTNRKLRRKKNLGQVQDSTQTGSIPYLINRGVPEGGRVGPLQFIDKIYNH